MQEPVNPIPPLKIKVCGLRWSKNIDELLAKSPPAFIGLNFYKKSSRYCLNGDSWWQIPKAGEKRIGVYVNSEVDSVVRTINDYSLDGVQLHGDESVDYCKELRSKLDSNITGDFIIIKVISVPADASDENIVGLADEINKKIAEFRDVSTYFLFDAKATVKGVKLRGGTGRKFNWKIFNYIKCDIPFLIAGGVGENIRSEIRSIQNLQKTPGLFCLGIDINSKVEVSPGNKDINKISIIAETIRNTDEISS